MARKVFEKLDYAKIQKINWANADLIRDKGNGKNEDTHSIVFPLITLKRFMDLREEHKINEIRTSEEYDLEDQELVQYLNETGLVDKRFRVFDDKEEWYDVEWEDILRFEENKDGEEINYHLGHQDDEDYSHRLVIKTKAKTQTEFLFEVIESFDNEIIKEMLDEYEFEKTFNKVLPAEFQREALETFKEVKYYLEFANEDVFGDVYMDITARFAASGGKKGGEFFTPTELTKAITRMRNPKMNGKQDYLISDITAGACTFMTYAAEHIRKQEGWSVLDVNKHITFITQEKEKNSEIFGKLNIAFHGYENHKSYHANSILNWKSDSDGNDAIGVWENKIDCVLANPPYGLSDYGIAYATDNESNENRWEYGVPKKGEGEYAFIASILNLLNENGEAAVVLPLGTQFKDSTKLMRQKMIEEGVVEAVVNMPSSMFLTTGIPVCVWFLKKGRTQEEIAKGVYMMNASESFTKIGNKNLFTGQESEKAINMFIKRETEECFAEYVDMETVAENDFNLSVTRYVYKEEIREEIDIEELNNDISDLYTDIIATNKSVLDMMKG
jgi:type I restriction system adenine methylase HsdM